VVALARSTICAWRSAPAATDPIAAAISPTARLASSEVEAMSCDAALIDAATSEMRATSTESSSRIRLYAPTDATVAVVIAFTASAVWPISSWLGFSIGGVTGVTATVRSPVARASSPAFRSATQCCRSIVRRSSTGRSPRVIPLPTRNANPPASSAATSETRPTSQVARDCVDANRESAAACSRFADAW
jgi:hypothetical protein